MQALVNASSWADLPLRDRRILVYQSLSSRAPSTVAKYLSEHRKFINFLTHSSRPTKLPSDSLHISLYLAYLSQIKHSYNVVLQAHCGIKWVHSLLPTDKNGNPAESTLSTNIVEAAKRVFKKPVRKKQPISTEVVVKICKRFASPPCTVIDLRTSLMFSLGFAGLFRASELLALRASDIKIAKDHLEVLVRKLKTDRYHQGNTVYITKTNGPACPHSLLLRFYSLAGIEPLTEAYIFQPISSLTTKGGKTKSNRPIGYSSVREIIKKALAAVGKIPEMFGTHSLRSGGATAIAERTSNTPDRGRLL